MFAWSAMINFAIEINPFSHNFIPQLWKSIKLAHKPGDPKAWKKYTTAGAGSADYYQL